MTRKQYDILQQTTLATSSGATAITDLFLSLPTLLQVLSIFENRRAISSPKITFEIGMNSRSSSELS